MASPRCHPRKGGEECDWHGNIVGSTNQAVSERETEPHDREEESQTGDEDHVVLTMPAREEQVR
jgi:hypothetical protein